MLTQNLTAEPTDKALSIAEGQNITLDLNGYTLDRGLEDKEATAEGNVIRVGKGVSLTIKDGTITGSHPNNGIQKGALRCEETKELNLNNVRWTMWLYLVSAWKTVRVRLKRHCSI